MSITTPDPRISEYNPVVATTTFAANFPVFDNSDLGVYLDDVERFDFTVTASYVDGISNDAKVVFATGLIGNVKVFGKRSPRRTSRFQDGRPIPIPDFNLALDTVEAEMQEAARDLLRAHKAPAGEEGGVFDAADIGNAQANATSAAASAALAAKWADNGLLDVTPGKKSSWYWAQKALEWATGGVAGVSSFIGRTGAVVAVAGDYTATQIARGVGTVESALAAIESGKVDRNNLCFEQYQLVLSGGNLVLLPKGGNLITVNDLPCLIPAAGVSLAPTGLSPGTTYYIFTHDTNGDGTVDGLEAVSTASSSHTKDASSGAEVKTGDATRTLVGMARIVTGPAWSNTIKQRFVRSWANDPGVRLQSNFTANRATTSTSYVELNTEIRTEFLIWAGETAHMVAIGSVINGAANGQNRSSIAFDGLTPEVGGSQTSMSSSDIVSFSAPSVKAAVLAEGYHYATLVGLVASGTGTWYGDVDGRRSTLTGFVGR